MSFLSDSDDGDVGLSMSPLQQEIFGELCNSESLIENEPTPMTGFVGTPQTISEGQLLFTVIDYYTRMYDKYYQEKIVRLWPGPGHLERFVHLRDDWLYSTLSIGDPCFIIANWHVSTDPNGAYENKVMSVIDQSQGYIIILPHVLITGTYMATSQKCRRQAYITNLCPDEGQNMDMFRGTICHELVQRVLRGITEDSIVETLDNLLAMSNTDLFLMNTTQQNARDNIEPYLDTIKLIAQEMANRSNNRNFNLDTITFNTMPVDSLPPYGSKAVHEEENLWSFLYGLKGKIDATMEKQDGIVFPFELKTGSSYRGQVREENVLQLSSYIFMMKERYGDKAASYGLLFYLKDRSSFFVKPRQKELTNIIIHRNSIAHSIAHGTVPATACSSNMCRFCPGPNICAFLDDKQSPIHDFLETKLTYNPLPRHREFYKKWENQLAEELMVYLNQQTQVWLLPVKKRVSQGRAIMNLRTISGTSDVVEFVSDEPDALSKTLIAPASMVLITRNGIPPIVGRGTIQEIANGRIYVQLIETTLGEREENICIDVWDSFSTVTQCRKNITTMLTSESANAQRLRHFIVENKAPVFESLQDHKTLMTDTSRLNEDQIEAINTARAAKDYMLLLGMPGTGKTTAVSQLIEAFVNDGKTVLVCSYTHTAVDNMCVKLLERNIDFLRIGHNDSIKPEIRPYSLETILTQSQSIEEMQMKTSRFRVFAATCLGSNHVFLTRRSFDVCVIDEASQISMPAIIGPMLLCAKYILVGDHYQLPPISRTKNEQDASQQSLFRMLCENHPHALVTLRTQYRMNNEIMRLCNELVYSNRMRAGNALSAQNKMRFPNRNFLDKFHEYHKAWVSIVLRPDPAFLFIDTDTVPMLEQKGSGSKLNVGEASIAAMIAVSMIMAGIGLDSIGVISPYRAQVMFIRKAFRAQLSAASKYYPELLGINETQSIEVDTVDKFQGRDKDCIIISTVKSNDKKSPGLHTTDWQRLNVAITRAKLKLIIVGSKSTLVNSPFFERLFNIIDDENVLPVPSCVNEGSSAPFISIPSVEALSSIETQEL